MRPAPTAQTRFPLFIALVALALSAVALTGCSDDTPGCSADADCRLGRICVDRVCQEPDENNGENNGVNNGQNNGVNNGQNNGVNNGVNNGQNNGVNNGQNNGLECVEDEDCLDAEFCNLDNNTCVEGCRLGGCGDGSFCDPETRECVVDNACQGDSDCGDSEYCNDGACAEGCREGGCPDGETCDLETRTCELLPCEADDQCADGEFCDAEGACREGCRLGGCDDGEVCNLETRACETVPCEVDDECADSQYCETDSGVCADGCRIDGCGDNQFCDTDVRECRCDGDLGCGDGEYCDEGECLDGCREGGCGDGEFCDTDIRECRCGADIACGDAEYCDEGECVEGCRIGGCGDGEVCDEDTRECVEAPCEGDADCADAEYCDEGACTTGCREGGCDVGFRCNLDSRECELDLDEGPTAQVDPEAIEFGEVGQNVSAFRELTVSNSGDEPLVISNVVLEANPSTGFQVIAPGPLPITLDSLEEATWRVRFEPTFLRNGEPTNYSNTVLVQSNDEQVDVPLTGTGVPDPEECLRFSTRDISFGFVPPGDIEAETVQLQNCGNTELQIESIDIDGHDEFSVVVGGQFPRGIEPGDSISLVVNYLPEGYLGGQASLIASTIGELEAESIVTADAAPCPTARVRGRVGDEGDYANNALRASLGDAVELDGSQSDDPAGGDLEFAWVVDLPDGSEAEFDPNLESEALSFAPDVPGTYRFTLTTTSELTGLEACDPAVFTVVVPLAVVEIVWDNNTDMDLHLIRSVDGEFSELGTGQNRNENDCYFNNRNPDWGEEGNASDNPSYLVDDTDGNGPETILIPAFEEDRRYLVSARLSQRRRNQDTDVTVRVTIDGQTTEFEGTVEDQGEVFSPVIIEGDGTLTPTN